MNTSNQNVQTKNINLFNQKMDNIIFEYNNLLKLLHESFLINNIIIYQNELIENLKKIKKLKYKI